MIGNNSIEWVPVEVESTACLSKLNHLSYLTTLFIKTLDAKLVPRDIPFENLTRYVILIGKSWGWRTDRTLKHHNVDRSLKLEDGIIKLLERSKELELSHLLGHKHILYLSDRKSFTELKHLQVSTSPNIHYINSVKPK